MQYQSLLLIAVAAIAMTAISPAGAAFAATTAPVDADYALVQLNGEPLSTYVKTKPGPGKKIDFNSTTTKSYRSQLSALRNAFKQWLQINAPKAQDHRLLGHLAERRRRQAERHDAHDPANLAAGQARRAAGTLPTRRPMTSTSP